MVFRIGLVARIPRELLGEHNLAALERRDLEVGRAEVETDAVTVCVVLDDNLALVHDGHLLVGHNNDLERLAVEILEEVVVELARPLRGVVLRDRLHNPVRTGEIELPAASRPQHELHATLNEMHNERTCRRLYVAGKIHIVTVDVTIFTFPRNTHDLGLRTRIHAQIVKSLRWGMKAVIDSSAAFTFALLLCRHDILLLLFLLESMKI